MYFIFQSTSRLVPASDFLAALPKYHATWELLPPSSQLSTSHSARSSSSAASQAVSSSPSPSEVTELLSPKATMKLAAQATLQQQALPSSTLPPTSSSTSSSSPFTGKSPTYFPLELPTDRPAPRPPPTLHVPQLPIPPAGRVGHVQKQFVLMT